MLSRLAWTIPALALIAAIGAGCSSSSTNSTAPAPVPGPNFSFAFPTAGSVATPGTSNRRFFTKNEVGSWTYRCIPHGSSGMRGTVIVDTLSTRDSATVEVGAVGTNAGGLNFVCVTCDVPGSNSVTIKRGGYVRWFNVSTMTNHTVTRP